MQRTGNNGRHIHTHRERERRLTSCAHQMSSINFSGPISSLSHKVFFE